MFTNLLDMFISPQEIIIEGRAEKRGKLRGISYDCNQW